MAAPPGFLGDEVKKLAQQRVQQSKLGRNVMPDGPMKGKDYPVPWNRGKPIRGANPNGGSTVPIPGDPMYPNGRVDRA